MQSVSSRIWTRVAVSNSYGDNHYTTGTSLAGLMLYNYGMIFLYKLFFVNYILSFSQLDFYWEAVQLVVEWGPVELVVDLGHVDGQ